MGHVICLMRVSSGGRDRAWGVCTVWGDMWSTHHPTLKTPELINDLTDLCCLPMARKQNHLSDWPAEMSPKLKILSAGIFLLDLTHLCTWDHTLGSPTPPIHSPPSHKMNIELQNCACQITIMTHFKKGGVKHHNIGIHTLISPCGHYSWVYMYIHLSTFQLTVLTLLSPPTHWSSILWPLFF